MKILYPLSILTFTFLFGCNSQLTLKSEQHDKKITQSELSMTDLQEKAWEWQGSYYNNDTDLKPVNALYQVTFTPEGKLQIIADCNRVNTDYAESEKRLKINPQYISTRAYCGEESIDSLFLKDLMRVTNWLIHREKLVLEIDGHTGRMEFISK